MTGSFAWSDDKKTMPNSFVLCDPNTPGLAVQYVSSGFRNLYKLTSADCLGRSWVSWQCVPQSIGQKEQADVEAEDSHLSPSTVAKKLAYLSSYACAEHRSVLLAQATDTVGVSWLLNCTANGAFFVCEHVSFKFHNARLGSLYICVQKDITDDITIASLLAVAGTGEYIKLMQARRAKVRQVLTKAHIETHVVPELRIKVEKLWAAQAPTLGDLPSLWPENSTSEETAIRNMAHVRRISVGRSRRRHATAHQWGSRKIANGPPAELAVSANQ